MVPHRLITSGSTSWQHGVGVQRRAVASYLKMQVGSGSAAGFANLRNRLSCLYNVARAHEVAVIVSVEGCPLRIVLDDDTIAETRKLVAGVDYPTGPGRKNGRANGRGNIQAFVVCRRAKAAADFAIGWP